MLITVDGQSSTGKSALAGALARRLSYHFLGSGTIYRLLADAILRNEQSLDAFIQSLQHHLEFVHQLGNMQVILKGEDITARLNDREVTKMASTIAKDKAIRDKLVMLQYGFNKPPGLVAEGRDMGTVIFPTANIKFFLVADVEVRAQRRHKQLVEMGMDSELSEVVSLLKSRDHQDETRLVSPLVPAEDALIVDTSGDWDENLDQMYHEVIRQMPRSAMNLALEDAFEKMKKQAFDLRTRRLSGEDLNIKEWWRSQKQEIEQQFGCEPIVGATWLMPIYRRTFDATSLEADDFHPPDFVQVDKHFYNQLMRIPQTKPLLPLYVLQLALNVGQGLAMKTVTKDYRMHDFVSTESL